MAGPSEAFAAGTSVLHRLDPRARLGAAAALSVALAVVRSLEVGAAGLVLGAALAALARLPLAPVARRLLLVNGFTLFLWIMLPLTYGGDTLDLAGMELSRGGLAMAALITLKTNAVVCVILALVATTPVPHLGRAMRWWRVPGKLCWLLVFSYRYLFLIHEEYQRLRRAASMRCFRPRTSLLTYRTFGNLIGMTLVRSYNRSRRVGLAMQLRGFSGRFHALDLPAASRTDALAGMLLGAVALALLLADRLFTF